MRGRPQTDGAVSKWAVLVRSRHHKEKIFMAVQSLNEAGEVQQLRDSARGFMARSWPPDRALERGIQPEALQEFCHRTAAPGWTSLGSEDEVGGLREVHVLLEGPVR